MTDYAALWSPDPPYLHVADGSATTLAEALPPSGARCFVGRLDARRMTTAHSVFERFTTEFRFPVYFGWNWNAFTDCLRDLTWMPADKYLVVIAHPDALLSEEPDELDTALRILRRVGRVWGQAFGREPDPDCGYVAFNTVLLDPSPELAARLERDAARY